MNAPESPSPDVISYRPAHQGDTESILALVEPFVAERKLLPRTTDEVQQLTTSGFSALSGDLLVGFAAVEIYSTKLAEILCLAVADGCQGLGVGKRLVQMCIDLAAEQDVREVMAISSAERFLRDCGFDYTLPDEKRALFFQLRPR